MSNPSPLAATMLEELWPLVRTAYDYVGLVALVERWAAEKDALKDERDRFSDALDELARIGERENERALRDGRVSEAGPKGVSGAFW